MPTIHYKLLTKTTVSEEVPHGLRVKARCAHRIHQEIDFNFDCTEALQGLTKNEVEQLALYNWNDGEVTERIADSYAEDRTSQLFTILNIVGDDYYVVVDKASAVAWLKQHRPEWVAEFRDDPDFGQDFQ